MSSYKSRIAELAHLLIVLLILPGTSCKKDWLNAKSDISLVVPSSLQDLQLLLDNTNIFNVKNAALGEIGADNYFMESPYYEFMSDLVRKSYLWRPDVLDESAVLSEWSVPYQQIFYSNTILEAIDKVEKNNANEADWNIVKGRAYFFRAFAYYDLLQIFTKPYSATSAHDDMGLPIRLSTNMKEVLPRSSVKESYDQVIMDLKEAAYFLPEAIHQYKSRPSKPAAYGLLARAFLSMEDYENAFHYADSCLQVYNHLIDYNLLTATSSLPIPKYSDEVIFHNGMAAYYMVFFPGFSLVDTDLYNSYHENDKRKEVFFDNTNGSITWRGNYSGDSYEPFNGIAVDEIVLIKAEANARLGNTQAAIDDLNTLMINRWKEGEFTPFTTTDIDDALRLILTERRKELLFRGLRWTYLRRLNKDPRFAITLTRELNGQTYTLPPNDNRYVYPIPSDEIRHSGIPQNPR